MKTFKDLEFKDHSVQGGIIAQESFNNSYGVSVVRFNGAYADENTFEVAILKNGNLCYTTEITDDVLGYQSESDINEVMKLVQELG